MRRLHMHVTPFSAATILVFAIASPLHAQGIEVFGGYSVNADYVQNRPAIPVVDQKVSPFFSHGSGPTGFEASFKRDVRNGLGIKVDVSAYSDTFPPGPAAYCQPDSSTAAIACGTGLTFQAIGRALYVTAGPEWKIRRGKRLVEGARLENESGDAHALAPTCLGGRRYASSRAGGGLVAVITRVGSPWPWRDFSRTASDY